jgi:predicted RNA-binding Zn-ribbon protein involved in translation (DUF1610 family)
MIHELCPHCDNEVEIKESFSEQRCPRCGNVILPCSMCNSEESECGMCFGLVKEE